MTEIDTGQRCEEHVGEVFAPRCVACAELAAEEESAPAGLAIGRAIQGLRELAGMSLGDVAEVANVTSAYLTRVERGVLQPTKPIIARVAKAIASRLEAKP